jgi:hypothetical protein
MAPASLLLQRGSKSFCEKQVNKKYVEVSWNKNYL